MYKEQGLVSVIHEWTRNDLSILAAFLAVGEERMFTKAAKRLAGSPSAISHAIRGLEESMGVRLLSRTTRSVAPTDAGEQLLARLRPALGDIQEALEQISGFRDKPAGRVRLLVPRLAATTVLGPNLALFARNYPDVVLDITADDSRMDIVAGGFDAGIHSAETFRKTRSRPGSRKTTGLPSSQRLRILKRTRSRRRRTIYLCWFSVKWRVGVPC